jgi:hypothetical protein
MSIFVSLEVHFPHFDKKRAALSLLGKPVVVCIDGEWEGLCPFKEIRLFRELCKDKNIIMYVSPSSHCPHSFFLQVAKTPASLSPLNPCDSGTPHKTAHELAKLPAVWNANHEAWRTARKSELEASFAGALVHCIALAFCVKQALFCR